MTARLHWYPAYIGVGSNLHGPSRQVETAFSLLAKLPHTRLVTTSSLYRSSPFGGVEQPNFVNAVAALLTRLQPRDLLAALQQIEDRQGRDRSAARWGPRVLDLDLLVWGGRRIDDADFVVPHPGIAERNFVLLPLVEIAPDLVVPGLGRVASLPVVESEPRIERIP